MVGFSVGYVVPHEISNRNDFISLSSPYYVKNHCHMANVYNLWYKISLTCKWETFVLWLELWTCVLITFFGFYNYKTEQTLHSNFERRGIKRNYWREHKMLWRMDTFCIQMDSCFILDICIVTMHVKLLHIEVFNRNEIMEKKVSR